MTTYITDWRPEKFKAELLRKLAHNAETVGVFVESEARRRLDAITEPNDRRSEIYRAYLSRWVLTHTVKTGNQNVTITVGMRARPGSGGQHHGFYIEIGSSTAPAHPYLRPAVFNNGREIVQLLLGES